MALTSVIWATAAFWGATLFHMTRYTVVGAVVVLPAGVVAVGSTDGAV